MGNRLVNLTGEPMPHTQTILEDVGRSTSPFTLLEMHVKQIIGRMLFKWFSVFAALIIAQLAIGIWRASALTTTVDFLVQKLANVEVALSLNTQNTIAIAEIRIQIKSLQDSMNRILGNPYTDGPR